MYCKHLLLCWNYIKIMVTGIRANHVLYKDTYVLNILCPMLPHALAYLCVSAAKLTGSSDAELPSSPVGGFILPVL